MKKLFSVIFMNFFGFDMIIFLVAVATALVFYFTKNRLMFSTTSFILTSSFPTQVLPAVRLTAIFRAFVKQISFLCATAQEAFILCS